MIRAILKKRIIKDLKDDLQYLAAKKIKAKYLVTRNVSDFFVHDILVVTPEEFLSALAKEKE